MFEGVFLTEEQVQRCEEMYLNKVKSSNPLHLSWKALKEGSMGMEEKAVEAVIATPTPKNIEKRKTRSGRKVPDGPGHFNPIYQEWKDILDPPDTAEPRARKPKFATKEKIGKKTIARKGKSL